MTTGEAGGAVQRVPRAPNAVLRGIRESERRESQAEFAEAMARVARDMGMEVYPDSKYVQRLESGHITWPHRTYRNILERLCERSAHELGLAPSALSAGDPGEASPGLNVELREAVWQSGMELAEFSRKVGVHLKTAERWITRGVIPQPFRRWTISLILGIDESELWPEGALNRELPNSEPKAAHREVDSYNSAGKSISTAETELIPLGVRDSERAAWEVAELIQRLEHSDVGATKLEILAETVNRLCSDYGREPANSLHPVIREWIGRISEAMDRRTTLTQHRELLVCAGWLFLLSGCVEYDMGWKGAADTSRIAALQIGRETGHGEIQAWSWEMAAWFALTQGRMGDVAAYVNAGQRIGGKHSVIVQLDAQLAKSGARMGDSALVRRALDSGYTKLSRMPRPDNPRNHFVVDPDKWDFYAMDAYRMLGDDTRATAHAKEVLRLGQGADGKELAPMRMAEARLTLGFSAARSGELEEAVTVSESAFSAERKSLPTLLMVAGELKAELENRYPREAPTRDYIERLTELKRTVYMPELGA